VETAHADGGIAAQIAFDAGFDVRRLLCDERQPIPIVEWPSMPSNQRCPVTKNALVRARQSNLSAIYG